jgi:hypothetical protein
MCLHTKAQCLIFFFLVPNSKRELFQVTVSPSKNFGFRKKHIFWHLCLVGPMHAHCAVCLSEWHVHSGNGRDEKVELQLFSVCCWLLTMAGWPDWANFTLLGRVARWYAFKQKIQIWVNFGGHRMKKVGIYYGQLDSIMPNKYKYFMSVW